MKFFFDQYDKKKMYMTNMVTLITVVNCCSYPWALSQVVPSWSEQCCWC